MEAPDTNTSVTSHGQSGGITAGNVTLNNSVLQMESSPSAGPPATPWWKQTWKVVSGAIVVAAAAAAVLTYFHLQPKERPVPDDKKVNVTSYNQSGGITAHTVNIGPQPRTLSTMPKLTASLRDLVPKTKPVDVYAVMGDADGMQFASEIYAFLGANGYKLKYPHISQGVRMPVPSGVSAIDHGDYFEVVVGTK